MEKQFVPYKLALKLRELGFNEECFAFYVEKEGKIYLRYGEGSSYRTKHNYENVRFDKITNSHSKVYENRLYGCLATAPLWQQAFDWMSTRFDMHGNVLSTGENGKYQTFEYTKGYGGTSSNGKTYSNIYKCRTELLKNLIKYKS